MADDPKRPPQAGHLAARTSQRVERMGDDDRAELARKLAARSGTVPRPGSSRTDAIKATPAPRVATDVAAAATRLAAELRSTEQRLDRIERFSSRGRYQSSGSGPAVGRYARLSRRADRLARQLNSLG